MPGLLAYTFGAFVAASIVLEFVRGTRARHALSGGSWLGALVELVGRNRRRYGGYIVHASILLLAIGIAGSSAYQTVRERGLHAGPVDGGRGLHAHVPGLETRQEANAVATRAVVDVSRGGSHVTTLHPGKNCYPVEQQVSNEVSIYHDPRNIGDLFTIADQIDPKSQVLFLKVLVKPLVNLIWAAGLPVRLRRARRDVAGRGRAAQARGALRAGRRRGMTVALVLAALLAVLAVAFVARPFLREPAPASDRLDELSELGAPAARARGGARPRARGAEGARIRPSHGQGLRRRLPGARRPAPQAGSRDVTCARTAGRSPP